MENERNFLGIWIPAEVWLDHSISVIERALFAEIHSLDGPRGCFASNEYFAENFGVTVATISKGIARLKEAGYIEQVSFDGRRRILRSLLRFERQTSKKLKADTNGFEGSVKDFGRQYSNPLKHIEKKITKTDNTVYIEEMPARESAASAGITEGQTTLLDLRSGTEIAGRETPKAEKLKKQRKYMTPGEQWPPENEGPENGWRCRDSVQVFGEWLAARYPDLDPEAVFGDMQQWAVNRGYPDIKKAGGYDWSLVPASWMRKNPEQRKKWAKKQQTAAEQFEQQMGVQLTPTQQKIANFAAELAAKRGGAEA